MATPIQDLRAQLLREINVPGAEQLPDITNSQVDGYIADGFWETRLYGMLAEYTLTDGTEFATPVTGGVIKLTADDGDLPPEYQMLVVIVGALKLLRMKVLNLAVNFKAVGGPVSFEQQASATTLRAVLATLQDRLNVMQSLYSESLGAGAMFYFDSVLQRDASLLGGALESTVLY